MSRVPQYELTGTSTEIGLQHGQLASSRIEHSLELYRNYFKEQAGLEWDQVRELAKEFAIHIARDHPDLFDEMKSIAKGSGQDWLDIVALNVRSEIGLASPKAPEMKPIDGCTAFSWRDSDGTFWSAQNWDWKSTAASSLISLDIRAHAPSRRPRIKMMTEAGVIGKIGINEHGVSVLLNALKTDLRDSSFIPIHLLLRRLLELPSVEACRSYLASPPIISSCASAAHILVTDPNESISLEILPTGSYIRCLSSSSSSPSRSATILSEKKKVMKEEEEEEKCFLSHTNHLKYTSEPTETLQWPDSFPRQSTLERSLLSSLAAEGKTREGRMSFEKIREILSDRSLGPQGICRFESEREGDIVTVFCIAIKNSKDCKVQVVVGRPDEGGEKIEYEFS